jgi:hypothetical protein
LRIQIDDSKVLTIPEHVIVDLSDLRMLTQQELLLRLAMERVRSVPDKPQDDELHIPRISSVHGISKSSSKRVPTVNVEGGRFQLNGVKILYDNGFYGTCVLKAKEVFRLMPELRSTIPVRLLVANALVKMNLRDEALSEYAELSKEKLDPQQRAMVDQQLGQLKKNKRG